MSPIDYWTEAASHNSRIEDRNERQAGKGLFAAIADLILALIGRK